MKTIITYEGDTYEDADRIALQFRALDLWSANWEVRQKIRSRLKYGPEEGAEISDSEEKFLEEIQETLYIEGLE